MNYSEMTDYQINNLVHNALLEEPFRLDFLEDECIKWTRKETQIITSKVDYTKNGLRDYCNSWADAGTIIEEYGISLQRDSADRWLSNSDVEIHYSIHAKPLRAAMVAFLTMQESK